MGNDALQSPGGFRAARKRLGMTQKELAEAMGLSTAQDGQAIRYYESGRRKVSKAMARLLGYIIKFGPVED